MLQTLYEAKPSSQSYVRDLQWDEGVVKELSPELSIAVSKEAMRSAHFAAEKGETWENFDFTAGASKKGSDEVTITGKDFGKI